MTNVLIRLDVDTLADSAVAPPSPGFGLGRTTGVSSRWMTGTSGPSTVSTSRYCHQYGSIGLFNPRVCPLSSGHVSILCFHPRSPHTYYNTTKLRRHTDEFPLRTRHQGSGFSLSHHAGLLSLTTKLRPRLTRWSSGGSSISMTARTSSICDIPVAAARRCLFLFRILF